MPWYDLPLPELRKHVTQTPEPEGLDAWWAARLDQARAAAKPPELTRYEPDRYGSLTVYDVEFSGDNGDPIRAWYLLPPAATGPVPVVVKFVGYGGGRGLPVEHTLLPAAGYALFVMDTRGQGGRWSQGATGDPAGGGTGAENSMVMTRGIGRPEDYYYARLYTDAVRAVETAATLDGADGGRLAVSGHSQGGALALASAALAGGAVKVCHADVPFMCDIHRAISITPEPPFTEVSAFLEHRPHLIDTVLSTLSYFDAAVLARRITATCLLSTGLMDTICPPSTVFAAYNAITAPKDIAVSPYGTHTATAPQAERQLAHLGTYLR